jgi:hypothetical protein
MSKRVTADWQSEPITFASQALLTTFGGGTPREQIVWSLILSIMAYVLTIFSAGATAILIIIFSVTFIIGVIRLLYAWLRG